MELLIVVYLDMKPLKPKKILSFLDSSQLKKIWRIKRILNFNRSLDQLSNVTGPVKNAEEEE